MKRCIVGIHLNPPVRDTSHCAGWVSKWVEILNADVVKDYNQLDGYDEIYIYNDVNSSFGKLNLYGYKKEQDNPIRLNIENRLFKLYSLKDKVKQLDWCQNYGTIFSTKSIDMSDDMITFLDNIDIVVQPSVNYVVGDSHSTSVAPKGYGVNRNDGKTLRGALKLGLSSYIKEDTKHAIFKFGDIDLRHHINRKDNPFEYIKELVLEYINQMEEIRSKGIKVSCVHAMAQTSDTRKIPKTGYFKGQPFYGTLEERVECTKYFNHCLDIYKTPNIQVISYPEDYSISTIDMVTLLNEDKMEAGGSFHLAPKHYLHKVEAVWKH